MLLFKTEHSLISLVVAASWTLLVLLPGQVQAVPSKDVHLGIFRRYHQFQCPEYPPKMTEHILPSLDYAYEALEPAISRQIMEIHHKKHHQLYVTNLNNAEKALTATISANSPADVKKQIELQAAIKFNGGGHINHSLFWKNLAPTSAGGGKLQDGPLKELIDRDFGGLDKLITAFNAATAAIQGSGWGWLGYNVAAKRLEITTTANQDPLIGLVPLIGVDAWEHAFYLQYLNVKADYFKAIWSVINFKEAEARLVAAQKQSSL